MQEKQEFLRKNARVKRKRKQKWPKMITPCACGLADMAEESQRKCFNFVQKSLNFDYKDAKDTE